MALPFSIENILARPTYRRIKPAASYAVRISPYPFFIAPPACPGTTRKRRKRYRTIFSETQILLLEELYRTTPYPDLYQRESVAFKACLQEERVEVWFKNRRARTRKLKRAAKKRSETKNDEESGKIYKESEEDEVKDDEKTMGKSSECDVLNSSNVNNCTNAFH